MIESKRLLSLSLGLFLASCGAPGKRTIEATLERAWGDNPQAMASESGLAPADNEPGLVHGAESSARLAVDAARKYGGEQAGNLAKDALGGAASLSRDFGVGGPGKASDSFGRAMARDWDVTNLEILDERASGDDYVVRTRYDVYAMIGGDRCQIGRDLTQTVRLVNHDGNWSVVR